MISTNSKGEEVRTNAMAEQVENGNCSDPYGIRGYIMDLVNKAWVPITISIRPSFKSS